MLFYSPLPNRSTLAILISPRKPKWGCQHEFPGITQTRTFLWKFCRNPEFPGISWPIPISDFGVPIFSVLGGNEVDMLGIFAVLLCFAECRGSSACSAHSMELVAYEESWDDWLCQGWVWVHQMLRSPSGSADKAGCRPALAGQSHWQRQGYLALLLRSSVLSASRLSAYLTAKQKSFSRKGVAYISSQNYARNPNPHIQGKTMNKNHDQNVTKIALLGGRFGYFLFLLGEGEGGVRGAGRGADGDHRFLIENPRRGGSPAQEGAEGPGGCLRRIGELGWGGAKYFFFRGRNVHQIALKKENGHFSAIFFWGVGVPKRFPK